MTSLEITIFFRKLTNTAEWKTLWNPEKMDGDGERELFRGMEEEKKAP